MINYRVGCDDNIDRELMVFDINTPENGLDITKGVYNKIGCPHYAGAGMCDGWPDITPCTWAGKREGELKELGK